MEGWRGRLKIKRMVKTKSLVLYQFTSGVGPYSADRDSQITLPLDSPLRLPQDPRVPELPPHAPKLRITVPIYSTRPLLEARFMSFHEEIWTDVMHGTMAPKDHREFMMRLYIENEILIRSRSMAMEDQVGDIEGTGPRRMTLVTQTFQAQVRSTASPYRYKDPFVTSESDASPTKRVRVNQNNYQSGESYNSRMEAVLEAPSYPDVPGDVNEEAGVIDPTLLQWNYPEPDELPSPGNGGKRTPTDSPEKPKELPEDISQPLLIPHGDGLGLSDEQLKSLLKLTKPARHKRASKVFSKNGYTFAKFKWLDEDNLTAKASQKQSEIDFYEAIGRSITRNGDPHHYVKLFQWTNPATREIIFPSLELAAEALENYGKPNEEMMELRNTAMTPLCGTKPARKRKAGNAEDAGNGDGGMQIEWTHSDLKHVFDPETETVPDNPFWNVVKTESDVVKTEPMDEW